MAGIAGISNNNKQEQVFRMLEKISHRGQAGSKVIQGPNATLGAVWPEAQAKQTPPTLRGQAAWDGGYPPVPDVDLLLQAWEPTVLAADTPRGLFLARDPLGIRPLYYGHCGAETMCFASEVKALLELTHDIHEFPPGAYYDPQHGFQSYSQVEAALPMEQKTGEMVHGLRLRLEQAISRRVDDEQMGCWLSGGLDSSAMAALVRPHVRRLHTFAAGVSGAPDLEFAAQVADFLGTDHQEVVVTLDELLAVLPDVIYYLESFDALLVRSSITNYLVARRAADYAASVFSGEGGDELFAGYSYLKEIDLDEIPKELVDITQRLHNTALQRVDRSASANGLAVHVPFLDTDVVEYALRIPPQLKLHDDGELTEKWIVRQALVGALPEAVLWRPKAKFWEGAGVGDLLSLYAQEKISDTEFHCERWLPNGWCLNTKEELMYYRIFHEHFGDLEDLSWMGRTKGSPLE